MKVRLWRRRFSLYELWDDEIIVTEDVFCNPRCTGKIRRCLVGSPGPCEAVGDEQDQYRRARCQRPVALCAAATRAY